MSLDKITIVEVYTATQEIQTCEFDGGREGGYPSPRVKSTALGLWHNPEH